MVELFFSRIVAGCMGGSLAVVHGVGGSNHGVHGHVRYSVGSVTAVRFVVSSSGGLVWIVLI